MKSELARRMDEVRKDVLEQLAPLGFKKRGAEFHRRQPDGIVHIVSLGAGRVWSISYGTFRIEVGIWLPEIHAVMYAYAKGPGLSVTTLRTSFEELSGSSETEWDLREPVQGNVSTAFSAIERAVLPLFEEFHSREALIDNWVRFTDQRRVLSGRARVDVAIMLASLKRGQEARVLLEEQLRLKDNKASHVAYVKDLAQRLGLGTLG